MNIDRAAEIRYTNSATNVVVSSNKHSAQTRANSNMAHQLRPDTSSVEIPGMTAGETVEIGELQEAIEDVQAAVDVFNRSLDFSVDEASGRFLVKVIDTSTEEVIREIPPEKVLRIAARMKELVGLLFDKKI